jgi:hypothetical protein
VIINFFLITSIQLPGKSWENGLAVLVSWFWMSLREIVEKFLLIRVSYRLSCTCQPHTSSNKQEIAFQPGIRDALFDIVIAVADLRVFFKFWRE